MKKQFLLNFFETIFVFSLVIFGVIKYFYDFQKRSFFEADQVYLTEQAQKILSGKLTLIGAPTSKGGIFIGPFYNYFTAIFLKIFNFNPHTVDILSSLWGILTPVVIYLVGKKILDQKTAFFASLLSLFSIRFLDRIGIPPLLFPLPIISLLTFYFLTQLKKNPKNLIIISTLVGISLHFHFSGVFFLFFLFFYLIFKKPKIKKTTIFASLIIFLIFLFPLFAFDLRHQFLNSRNFLQFIKGKGLTSSISLSQRVMRPFLIDYQYLKQIFIGFPDVFSNLIFFFLSIFSLRLFTKKKLILPFLIWLLGPPTLFIFYTDSIIPYYFILQFPIIFLFFGNSLKRIFITSVARRIPRRSTAGMSRRSDECRSSTTTYEETASALRCGVFIKKNNLPQLAIKAIAFVVLIFFVLENTKLWQISSSSRSLYYKIKALEFIKKESRGELIYLSHTVYPGLRFGYPYLEEYLKINKKDDKTLPNYTIIQPYNWHNIKPQYVFGDVGVNLPKNNNN